MRPEKILIAGAGIGGLTAACALRRRGFETEVFERAVELREAGAGLSLQANAVRALSLLGLDETVRDHGWPFLIGEMRLADGRRLGGIGFEDLIEQIGATNVGIHRGVLQKILLDHAGSIRTGCAATGFEAEDDGVLLRLQNGETAEGALLIGADGIRSAIRAQLHGAAEPRYAGYTCWRGIADVSVDDMEIPDIFEVWGVGDRFGGVRIGRDRFYWFAVRTSPPGLREEASAAHERVAKIFASYAEPIPALIRATPPETVIHNDILDHPPLERWGDGRVALLGDAAHAMTPNMGQGACQAIEDALVLADRLAAARDSGAELASGLAAYEEARRPRANRFVEDSRRFGKMAHWTNPVARKLRDGALMLTPDSVVRRQMLQVLTMTPVDEAGFRGASEDSAQHEEAAP